MRPIPLKIRQQLSDDVFMKKCCLCGIGNNIQFHHNLIYQGRQQNDAKSILPLCETCHRSANKKDVKEKLDKIMFERGLNITLYPKSGLEQRKKYLCK
jgi:hypothetical protein